MDLDLDVDVDRIIFVEDWQVVDGVTGNNVITTDKEKFMSYLVFTIQKSKCCSENESHSFYCIGIMYRKLLNCISGTFIAVRI